MVSGSLGIFGEFSKFGKAGKLLIFWEFGKFRKNGQFKISWEFLRFPKGFLQFHYEFLGNLSAGGLAGTLASPRDDGHGIHDLDSVCAKLGSVVL